MEFLNLTCGEDPAAALVTHTGGAEGQTLRILMIGNIARLSAYADLRFTVRFESREGELLLYQSAGDALIFYQSVTDGNDRFTAAEGYVLFGVSIANIPPEVWESALIELSDGETGQILCSQTVENSRDRADPE